MLGNDQAFQDDRSEEDIESGMVTAKHNRVLSKLTGVGCPSKSQSIFLNLSKSSSGKSPVSAQAAYRTGAACPCVQR